MDRPDLGWMSQPLPVALCGSGDVSPMPLGPSEAEPVLGGGGLDAIRVLLIGMNRGPPAGQIALMT